jgi:hypothetical protein
MSAWAAYAGAGLGILAAVALAASLATGSDAAPAIWFAAGIAWIVQLLAFAALVAVRRNHALFTAGWLGGMVIRFIALAALAFFGSRTAVFPVKPLLVSFVAFLFLMILLEPVFLKRGLRTS